eukprot:5628875-Amphidinium_carterae.3
MTEEEDDDHNCGCYEGVEKTKSDSVTAASTVISEQDMPLLLAGWTDRDQATKGQEAIQSWSPRLLNHGLA